MLVTANRSLSVLVPVLSQLPVLRRKLPSVNKRSSTLIICTLLSATLTDPMISSLTVPTPVSRACRSRIIGVENLSSKEIFMYSHVRICMFSHVWTVWLHVFGSWISLCETLLTIILSCFTGYTNIGWDIYTVDELIFSHSVALKCWSLLFLLDCTVEARTWWCFNNGRCLSYRIWWPAVSKSKSHPAYDRDVHRPKWPVSWTMWQVRITS